MAKTKAGKKNDAAIAADASRVAAFDSFLKANQGEVMRLSDPGLAVEVIPTGSIALDVALGVGGLPRGRVVEIYGPEHSGKTSVCLSIAGQVHKEGGTVGFVDAEHALDPEWAKTFGVQEDKIVINQPMSGEAGLDMVVKMCESGAFDLIIVDSVAALTPQAEIDGAMGDQLVGTHARMMSKGLRKLTGAASVSGTTVVFINQLRMAIGQYGNPETTTGGKALRFYSSVRIEVRSSSGDRLKNGTDTYGQTVRCAIKKNKVARPFTTAEFDLIYGKGIDSSGSILDAAEAVGLISRAKGSPSYVEVATAERIAVGKEAAKARIAEDAELRERLIEGVYSVLRGELQEYEEPEETMPEDVAAALEDEDNAYAV